MPQPPGARPPTVLVEHLDRSQLLLDGGLCYPLHLGRPFRHDRGCPVATTAWRWTVAVLLLIAPAAWGAWIWRSVPPNRVGLALTLLVVVVFWLVVLVSLEIAGGSDPVDARARMDS